MKSISPFESLFLFNDTAPTEIYTLSLHDALPICPTIDMSPRSTFQSWGSSSRFERRRKRSEEHTSELQAHLNLVCRLLRAKQKVCQLPETANQGDRATRTSGRRMRVR